MRIRISLFLAIMLLSIELMAQESNHQKFPNLNKLENQEILITYPGKNDTAFIDLNKFKIADSKPSEGSVWNMPCVKPDMKQFEVMPNAFCTPLAKSIIKERFGDTKIPEIHLRQGPLKPPYILQ
ncbi:MAG TPA: hypothetical protein PKC72_13610 [Chitinophagaceae bacterium]|nr:hypothetical protein [Chitinophagaceae bacterium]